MSEDRPPATYDDLSAVYINCTLKPSPERSHTELLGQASMDLMRAQGVAVTSIRGRPPDPPGRAARHDRTWAT